MNAADTYQQSANKRIKDMEEELKVIGAQKAEMDARVASLESALKVALDNNKELDGDYDKVKFENEKLQLEAQRLRIELGVLAEAKDPATNSCNTGTPEIMKGSEDLETKEEETKASKDLVKGENDELQLGIFFKGTRGIPPY